MPYAAIGTLGLLPSVALSFPTACPSCLRRPRLRPCHAYAGRHPEGSVMPPETPPLSLKHRDSAWNPLAVSETHFTVKRAVDVGRAGHPAGGPDGMAKKALPWWGFCGIMV